MQPNYQNAAMLDMIFENRNKAYGAYVLRRDYNKSLQQAMLITFSTILLLCAGNFIRETLAGGNVKEVLDDGIRNLTDVIIPKVDIPKPPVQPPNQPPAQANATIANAERRVVTEPAAQQDSIPSTVDLARLATGLTTNLNGATDGSGVDGGTGTGTGISPPGVEPTIPTEPTRLPDVMPVFPGGEAALIATLAKNTKFPTYLRDMGIGGKVVSEFTVNEDGTVTDIKIIKSPDPGFNKAVISSVQMLPAFKPGLQNGHPVKVRYVVPISFKVQ